MIERYFTITQVYSITRWKRKPAFLYGKEVPLGSYLRHSGLVRRVNEFWCIVVDVGYSHDHRYRPLLVGRLHRVAQLKNESVFKLESEYKNLITSSPPLNTKYR